MPMTTILLKFLFYFSRLAHKFHAHPDGYVIIKAHCEILYLLLPRKLYCSRGMIFFIFYVTPEKIFLKVSYKLFVREKQLFLQNVPKLNKTEESIKREKGSSPS